MHQNKTAFVTFFPIKPNNMGSSAVVNSRFENWPKKKKIVSNFTFRDCK